MSIRVPSASYSFALLSMIGAGLLASAPLSAQPQSPTHSSVSGVISWEGGGSVQGFQVELNDRAGRQSAWADVLPDGRFELRTFEMASQHYTLVVRNERGQIVHDDVVQQPVIPLEIHLRAPEQQRPITGVVSAEDLLNAIPGKAMRYFTRAQKAVEKGEIRQAIGHLRKAIRIHPQFVEAHNSLGVKYMMLGDFAPAAAAFEEAVRLRPHSGEPHSNLGVALHGLNRYDEAERQIRRSIELQPRAVKSHFALALLLSAQTGKEQEALRILAAVAGQIPEAHIHAAKLLARRADSRGVIREVRAYLDSGDNKHREMAERWLQSLPSSAQGPGGREIN